jgi:hypothetical protein
VEGDTADVGLARQRGSFQGAAPREDGDLLGWAPSLCRSYGPSAILESPTGKVCGEKVKTGHFIVVCA